MPYLSKLAEDDFALFGIMTLNVVKVKSKQWLGKVCSIKVIEKQERLTSILIFANGLLYLV